MVKVAYGVTQLARGISGSGVDGIGHYTQELIRALSVHSEVDLVPFSFGFGLEPSHINHNVKTLGRFDLEVLKGLLVPTLRMNSIQGERVDLIHATDHLVPYVKGVPLVATLMDAIPLSNPECVSSKFRLLTQAKIALWKKISRRADRIITISEYSKSEISKWFEIPLDRISVIPLGVDLRFFNVITPDVGKKIRESLNIPESYFLSVGTLQPRKNIGRILEAMRILPDYVKKANPIVIVGSNGWGMESIQLEIERAEQEGWCIRLRRVSDLELRALLQLAKGLVFPSLAEGFGLPVLEAFASRTPVITSNTTSLPEASNGAALLVDPTSVDDISAALLRILNDEIFVKDCIEKGYKHAAQMTWQKCAEDTIGIYNQLIEK